MRKREEVEEGKKRKTKEKAKDNFKEQELRDLMVSLKKGGKNPIMQNGKLEF